MPTSLYGVRVRARVLAVVHATAMSLGLGLGLGLGALGCGSDHIKRSEDPAKREDPARPSDNTVAAQPVGAIEPAAERTRAQDEYVEDIMAFADLTRDQVRARMKQGSEPLKNEWNAWEQQGAMTPDRINAFYKQTRNYIFELGEWHLFVENKRASDLALFADMKAKQPKNILDFGGGTGLIAIPLARDGHDVTLADLDSTSLDFARFRAEKRGVKIKFWKTDVEPMPPDTKYDVIMCLDVLEHLPTDILHPIVDKLIKLKHARTEIIISAPFGRTAVHPMHLDLTEDTKQQIARLRTELPPD